jgi:hypothetical protein
MFAFHHGGSVVYLIGDQDAFAPPTWIVSVENLNEPSLFRPCNRLLAHTNSHDRYLTTADIAKDDGIAVGTDLTAGRNSAVG